MHNQLDSKDSCKVKILSGTDMLRSLPLLKNNVRFLVLHDCWAPKAPSRLFLITFIVNT
jgi:hypothetical protein